MNYPFNVYLCIQSFVTYGHKLWVVAEGRAWLKQILPLQYGWIGRRPGAAAMLDEVDRERIPWTALYMLCCHRNHIRWMD